MNDSVGLMDQADTQKMFLNDKGRRDWHKQRIETQVLILIINKKINNTDKWIRNFFIHKTYLP